MRATPPVVILAIEVGVTGMGARCYSIELSAKGMSVSLRSLSLQYIRDCVPLGEIFSRHMTALSHLTVD